MIVDRIEDDLKEFTGGHYAIKTVDLYELLALARIGYETKVPWKISRTVKHAGDVEI